MGHSEILCTVTNSALVLLAYVKGNDGPSGLDGTPGIDGDSVS